MFLVQSTVDYSGVWYCAQATVQYAKVGFRWMQLMTPQPKYER